jgi:hypothetical protein
MEMLVMVLLMVDMGVPQNQRLEEYPTIPFMFQNTLAVVVEMV